VCAFAYKAPKSCLLVGGKTGSRGIIKIQNSLFGGGSEKADQFFSATKGLVDPFISNTSERQKGVLARSTTIAPPNEYIVFKGGRHSQNGQSIRGAQILSFVSSVTTKCDHPTSYTILH